jgi:cellulose synthase/poly-beta-1,6-N-acetylglucosamine synthase-like glycosyltransferase
VPAYNEADCIADTVNSLLAQSLAPQEIIVVDDGSTDATAAICRSLGVKVIAPPENTGSKAGAQNFALKQVKTKYTLAIDADTTLKSDALEKLFSAMADPEVVAACGFVIPRHVNTVWERGRYVEYLMAFTFNFHFMRKQLKRWAHGFIQNVRLHWKGILHVPFLRSIVTVMSWDATVASIVYLMVLPVLAVTISPLFLLGYVIDLPIVLVPTLTKAYARGETWHALSSIPAFFVLRFVNSAIFLEALFKEVVLRQPLEVYEKGH